MPRPLLLVTLSMALAAVASAQPTASVGLVIGAGGADGERPESYIAVSGGASVTTGVLLLGVEAEGSASWTDGGGVYAFDPETAALPEVDGLLCQNLQTGRYVESGSCVDSQARASFSADASLLVPYVDGLAVGGGYRFGFQPTPYAALGYDLGATTRPASGSSCRSHSATPASARRSSSGCRPSGG